MACTAGAIGRFVLRVPEPMLRASNGSPFAELDRMAAIMALIFVPAIAASCLMVMSNIGASPTATIAAVLFTLLAMGLFVALLKLSRRWEDEAP